MPTPQWIKSMSRLNVFALLRDQFKYLTSLSTNRPAWLVRALVLFIAPIGVIASLYFHWQMESVGDLVGALGLLSGVFLSAFAVVFGLRINIAARPTKVMERKTARLMDESALTLLSAGLLAGVDAMWLAVVSVSIPEGWIVSEIATAITVGLSALVVVYFLLSVRRMHVLYTDTFLPFWKVKAVVEGPANSTVVTAEDIDSRRNARV